MVTKLRGEPKDIKLILFECCQMLWNGYKFSGIQKLRRGCGDSVTRSSTFSYIRQRLARKQIISVFGAARTGSLESFSKTSN